MKKGEKNSAFARRAEHLPFVIIGRDLMSEATSLHQSCIPLLLGQHEFLLNKRIKTVVVLFNEVILVLQPKAFNLLAIQRDRSKKIAVAP